MRAIGLLPALMMVATAVAARADGEFSVIVPDHTPFIQAALDSGARWVYVRPGVYPEHLVLQQPADILALTSTSPAPLDSLPVIGGMTIAAVPSNWDCKRDGNLRFVDLRFAGPVRNSFTANDCSNSLEFVFTRCVMDSGLTDEPATLGGQLEWHLESCTIRGGVRLDQPQNVWMDDSRIVGTVSVKVWEIVRIRTSRIEGPGAVGLSVPYAESRLTLTDNHLTGFEVGILVGWRSIAEIERNVVEDCGTGIRTAYGEGFALTGNTVRRCGTAMDLVVNTPLAIGHNVIEDCGSGVRISGYDYVHADHNRIIRCGSGLRASNADGIWSTDNRFEAIAGAAIDLSRGGLFAQRDTILACGAGYVFDPGGPVDISGARIAGCVGRGISVRGGFLGPDVNPLPLQITGNVVGRCGEAGMALVAGPYTRIQGNTLYLNGGAGLACTTTAESHPAIERNVSFGNRGSGLAVSGGAPALACNDWFANDSGAVSGGVPGPTDLAVDPLFCDLDADDVRLRSDSPLVDAPGCGLIGAQGVGCADLPTPVLAFRLTAERQPEGTVLRWRGGGLEAGEAWIERADRRSGPYARIDTERWREGSDCVELDRSAVDGRACWYRLLVPGPDGPRVAAEIEVPPASTGRFDFVAVAPNPASRATTIEFTTAREASIAIDVFDAQVRRVATLARGTWPAGRHVLTWSGETSGGAARPGLYLLRYRFPGGHAHRRLLRMP